MQWQIKVHSFSTFRILRDTNCIEYGPVWYCLVENDCAFLVAIFGFNYRTLPEVFWQWRRWSVDHKPRWRKGSPEWVFETQIFPNQCWKGVNWWGWKLIAIVQCDSKKEVSVDLVHNSGPSWKCTSKGLDLTGVFQSDRWPWSSPGSVNMEILGPEC